MENNFEPIFNLTPFNSNDRCISSSIACFHVMIMHHIVALAVY